jgi:hypothetical protein
MVRRRIAVLGLLALACGENRPMADRVEMPHIDSAVLANPMKADSLLDTMPGGEMVRGSPGAAARLLETKTRR